MLYCDLTSFMLEVMRILKNKRQWETLDIEIVMKRTIHQMVKARILHLEASSRKEKP